MIDVLKLKIKRLAMGITAKELAELMYVTKQTIYNIESLKAPESSNNYYRLVIEDLWERTEYCGDERTCRLRLASCGVIANETNLNNLRKQSSIINEIIEKDCQSFSFFAFKNYTSYNEGGIT